MRTIVFAASKGGVGKTTLASAIGVEAARRHRVGMSDTDPQGSTARWLQLRGMPDNPKFYAIEKDKVLADAVRSAARDGCDYLIIDTPPALMTRLRLAISIADLVVIPCRASPLDVEAIEPVVDLCRTARKRFVFVLNAVQPRAPLTRETVDYLSKEATVLEIMIAQRPLYAAAMVEGLTAPEVEKDGKAGEEIRALWRVLAKLAGEDDLRPAMKGRR